MAVGITRRQCVSGLLAGSTPFWLRSLATQAASQDRILVTFELSGGNDGLNSIVPYADDAYYRHRPSLGIPKNKLLPLDDHFGFNPGMLGFKRLWDNGELAIFHGCGYDNPSYSHFTSMAYMHTARPNSGSEYGWVGRLADAMAPKGDANFIVNIDSSQSLAVNSRRHTPVVFDDPSAFQRRSFGPAPSLPGSGSPGENDAQAFLRSVAASGDAAAESIRAAWERYRTPVDYGIAAMDLDKIAACIASGLPTRLYYTAFRNNAFDTHVQQGPQHQRLIAYACDAVHGFIADLKRLGVADNVLVLVFSEFGRRVAENANQGTDHGTANVMFLAGEPVKGGHYGTFPSLSALRDDENIAPTTDFRDVYATAIEWLAPGHSATVLNGRFHAYPATAT